MLRIFLTFVALFPMFSLFAAPAGAQWDTQSPSPTHLDVRGVGAPTPSRAFIATEDNSFDQGGALFETTDGGATWVQRDVPENLYDPHNGMFFLDSQRGWVFGNVNSRTTDGGTTWTTLPFLGSTYFMRFYTPTFGLAMGNFDKFVSLDGGLNWVPSPNDQFAFDFADDQLGLGVAATGIYRTTSGGSTFALVRAGNAASVAMLSPTDAVAIADGSFVRSTDGGATWSTGANALDRTDLTAVSASVVLAWGRSGNYPDFDDRVLRSSDGGLTWTDLGEVLDASEYSPGRFAFTVVDPQTVVASNGLGDVLHSADAGATWSKAFESRGAQPGYLSSAAPAFADAQTGYFGYGPGFVIKTTDGGASWTQISSGTGASLNDVARFPDGKLIAVGEGGTLLRSAGSTPWIVEPAFTSFHLKAVQVLSAQNVVVVDEPGTVYRSSDGGTTWTAGGDTPANFEAYDLHFTTLLDGWVAGSGFSDGAVFHTTNGGDSWTAASGPVGLYIALDFEGSNGWALNVGGLLYRTTNSGASWESFEIPNGLSLSDVEFFDANMGYIVGWYGFAARSTDGGATWQELPTPSTDLITDIHLLNANELWVSTTAGAAYHSATGGLSWSVLDTETSGFGNYSAITAVPGGDAWMAGWQGYIEHFTGPPPGPVNQPPVADFAFAPAGMTVPFTDASSDPDGVVVSWAWDFGDGETSTEQSPTHTFLEEGTYIVTLTVTDDDGATGLHGELVVAQPGPGGTFGDFTEVTPLDPLFLTPQDEDFWVATTAPADYDGDGDLDIAVLGFYVVYNESVVHRLVLLRNDGPVTATEWEFVYVDVDLGELSAGASDLAWGDPDGDGDQDLLVATDGAAVLYRNDAGTLMATDTTLPGYYEDNDQANFDLNSVTWVDFDNDGDQDLLLPSVFDTEEFEYRTALLRNDGPNESGGMIFNEIPSPFAPTAHAQTAWADFDGDEDLDLLLSNLAPLQDEGFIRRYRNDGAGVFVGEDILGTLSVEHGEVQWGDYDADGDLDVLVAGNIRETDDTYNTVLRVYRNDAETYVPIEVISCVSCDGWFDIMAATWADYNSDGDVDILVAGTYNSGSEIEGRAMIFDNEGGVFTASANVLPAPRASGTRGGSFTWLDLDGEGDLDYFIAGEYFVPGGNGLIEAQMHVYRNDVEGQNLAPSAPANVKVLLNEAAGTATMTWAPSTDDHTPGIALTYDLEISRNGAPATPRRLPQPGSVSAVREWVLEGLTDGYYRWSVRAVDSAYNGSVAVQGSFVLGDPVGVETVSDLPRAFEFQGSSPNPFRTATTFRFAVPERANVDLSVYDVSGRLVERIVDKVHEPGRYDVRWDAREVAAGAYFVRLNANAFTETRRVMVVR